MTTRNQIAAALLTQLTGAGQFINYGLRDRAPEQAASPGKPGLYLLQVREKHSYDGGAPRGVPPVREMHFLAVIYTDVGADETAIPSNVIRNLLDVLSSALAAPVTDQLGSQGRMTLGGLVYDCRIEGDTEIASGDVQGKGSTVVPIVVVIAGYP